jgi:hypothetical protein
MKFADIAANEATPVARCDANPDEVNCGPRSMLKVPSPANHVNEAGIEQSSWDREVRSVWLDKGIQRS